MDSINRIIENGQEKEPVYKKKRGIVLLRQTDDLIFVSGHGPEDQITGKALFSGRVGEDLTPEEGYAIADVLEERGYHTRTVMGTRNLPNHNIPVEIEVIVEVES